MDIKLIYSTFARRGLIWFSMANPRESERYSMSIIVVVRVLTRVVEKQAGHGHLQKKIYSCYEHGVV